MTTTTFQPKQTRRWSTRELSALIGKQVTVTVNGAPSSGVVADASVGRFGLPFVEWEGGGGVQWDRDADETTITVEG